jgi:predicted nucleotide-binding protein
MFDILICAPTGHIAAKPERSPGHYGQKYRSSPKLSDMTKIKSDIPIYALNEAAASPRSRKIFVVHGHDDGARESVARFLESIGFEPVILHEQANRGATLIEKFQANSNVGFAVVLLTPDDFGGKAGAVAQGRARQNVVLEWGYFIGRLGRENVIALRKGDVELPSDLMGIVWQTLDEHGAWRIPLARELAAAGFTVDWQKLSS